MLESNEHHQQQILAVQVLREKNYLHIAEAINEMPKLRKVRELTVVRKEGKV